MAWSSLSRRGTKKRTYVRFLRQSRRARLDPPIK